MIKTESKPNDVPSPSFLDQWNWYHANFHKISVDQYHRMIQTGALSSQDRVELLDGMLVRKMPQNHFHAFVISILLRELQPLIVPDWYCRVQFPITLEESEPEPDLAIVVAPEERYIQNHPMAHDIGLIIEVADSSLDRDQTVKLSIYAKARIPIYWIVDLYEQQVRIYTQPRRGRNPTYRTHVVIPNDVNIPVTLKGNLFGAIPMSKLFPNIESEED